MRLPGYTIRRTESLHVCDLELLCLTKFGRPLADDPYIANAYREWGERRRIFVADVGSLIVPLILCFLMPVFETPLPAWISLLLAVALHPLFMKHTRLQNERRKDETIVPAGYLTRRLDSRSWAGFLAYEVVTFIKETALISVGDRILAEGDLELITSWGEETEAVTRETAEGFLVHYDIDFARYLSFCRDHRLQPWADVQLPLDWFDGYYFVGSSAEGTEPVL